MSRAIDDDAVRVRYARRPSQGVVLGISKTGLVSIGIAAAPVFVLVVTSGPLPGILAALLLSPFVAGGIVKRNGEPWVVWVVRSTQFKRRQRMGLTRWRRSPGPKEVGQVVLPGNEGRLWVWEAPDGSAVIWDAARQTASITCVVGTRGMAQHSISVLTPKEREQSVAGWMAVCGAWTRRRQIVRVTVQERTRPGNAVREQQHFDELHATGPLAESYQAALNQLGSELVWRPTTITVTLDAGSGVGRQLVKASGGGKAGVLALAVQEMSATTEALYQGGFTKVAWCSPREWGAWGRGIVHPAGEAAIDTRIGSAFEGIAPELAGPMSLDEERDYVETDSAFHRAYWVQEWPRLETLPGFMGHVAFAQNHTGVPVRHTLSLVGTPVPIEKALKRIRDERNTWKQNANMKRNRGGTTLADDADWRNLDQREQDLIDGQGELAFTGYVVVSGLSEDDLRQACASMEIASANAGIELLSLTHQQAAALMSVAYPAGSGMK